MKVSGFLAILLMAGLDVQPVAGKTPTDPPTGNVLEAVAGFKGIKVGLKEMANDPGSPCASG